MPTRATESLGPPNRMYGDADKPASVSIPLMSVIIIVVKNSLFVNSVHKDCDYYCVVCRRRITLVLYTTPVKTSN